MLGTLRELALEVDLAATPEGVLIIRGTRDNVSVAADLIESIGRLTDSGVQDVAIELIWLTEAKVAGALPFSGGPAQQLKERDFRTCTSLGNWRSLAAVGISEATGAGVGPSELSTQFRTHAADGKVAMELQVDAKYQLDEPTARIEFSTNLTTPLNRWIVFGVAQRRGTTLPAS